MEFKQLRDIKSWSIYFIVKLLLFVQGLLGFHLLANLGLVLILLLRLESNTFHRLRHASAVLLAAGLLYLDAQAVHGDSLLNGELLYSASLTTALISFVYYYSRRFIETSIFVLCGFLLVGLKQAGVPLWPGMNTQLAKQQVAVDAGKSLDETLQTTLDQFFKTAASRHHGYNPPAKPDFDIVFLSICSMAWRDLEVTGLDRHPLLERFDIYFDHFNSATSYSGPALIRLLRADCGQQPHESLFNTAGAGSGLARCEIFRNLSSLGFDEKLVMNHDGEFGGFLRQLRENGGIDAPLTAQQNLKVAQKSFDGTPIYDDGDSLDHWLSQRSRAPDTPQLVLYNTVTLHDGNRLLNQKNVVGLEGYEFRARHLLDQLQVFIAKLEASQRKTLLVLIPEHGAGLQGDKMQLSGMHEIPSPSITHIPVAVKLIGANRQGNEARVTADSSYFALSSLIQRITERDAFNSSGYSPAQLIDGLPTTQPVAQNEGSTVMRFKGIYHVSLDGGRRWSPYPGSR